MALETALVLPPSIGWGRVSASLRELLEGGGVVPWWGRRRQQPAVFVTVTSVATRFT